MSLRRINLGTDTSGRPLVVDERTLAKLRHAEAVLGFKFTIVQGSWSDADASAGTHTGAGVIDLRTWNLPARIAPAEAVRRLRLAGLIAWYRHEGQGFDPHIHAIDYGNPELAPAAARQVAAWEAGRNGLALNGPDDGARVTIPKNPPSEVDDMAWNEKIARWSPEGDEPGGTLEASQALNQARGYAEDAYRNAREAANRAERIEKAVRALARGFGREVEQAVEKALTDTTVEVDINVAQGDPA